MPKVDEQLDTQDQSLEQNQDQEVADQADQSESDEGHSSSDQDAGGQNQRESFFLDVDERHRYRTADEAKKAVSEASQRIASLSAWEKELKEYGDLSPADVRGYLDELISLRQEMQNAQSQIKQFEEEKRSQGEKGKESTSSADGSEKDLSADEKAARAWLAKTMPGLGYVPKSEVVQLVKELQDRFAKFEQATEQQQARYKESLVSDSRTKVQSWMSEAGFQDDEDGSLQFAIEGMIRDYINADDRRVTRFYTGGSVTEGVIKEAYERATKALTLVRNQSSAQSSSTYAKNKADALKRNGKKLPQNGIATKAAETEARNRGNEKRVNASGRRDFISEAHNRAWELAQSRWSGNRDEQ